jgi:hypothetical protein
MIFRAISRKFAACWRPSNESPPWQASAVPQRVGFGAKAPTRLASDVQLMADGSNENEPAGRRARFV